MHYRLIETIVSDRTSTEVSKTAKDGNLCLELLLVMRANQIPVSLLLCNVFDLCVFVIMHMLYVRHPSPDHRVGDQPDNA
jgi:hypothetical protein